MKYINTFIFLLIYITVTAHVNIVTTINPYAVICRQIGDTAVSVASILPPAASPHTYSPTPSDIVNLMKADIIIVNGVNLEHNIIHKLNDIKGHVINIGDSLGFDHNDKHNNPHIWLSPVNMKKTICIIKQALIRRDAANKIYFTDNAEHAVKGIDIADSIIKNDIINNGSLPIITFHNSFAYFLDYYNIELAGVIEGIPGREPTLKEITDIEKIIKQRDIKAIFTEPQLSPKSAEIIANEIGLKIFVLDPLGITFNISSIDELLIDNYNEMVKVRQID